MGNTVPEPISLTKLSLMCRLSDVVFTENELRRVESPANESGLQMSIVLHPLKQIL